MVVGQLEIQLLANVARLQTQMDQAKSMMSNAVSKFNQILGAVGVGVTFAGIANLVRSVADAGDKINDLRKITGLAAQDLAGLDKVAALNGTSLDQLSKALGIMSKNIVKDAAAFDTLGIATRNSTGGFRDSKEILLDIAGKFEKMEDGVQKSALAQQLFGKSGRELIPLLNEGKTSLAEQIQKYGEASGMTNQLASESDRFNDTLTELDGKFQSVKNTFIADILPTVNNIIKAFLDGETSTDKFSFSTKVFIPILKGLAIAGYTVVDTFRGIGREIGARAAQLTAFANLDFSGAKFIGQSLAEDNKKSRAEYDKFVETVMNADKVVQQYTQTQKKQQDTEDQNPPKIYKTIKALKEKKELTDAEKLAIMRQEESTKSIIDLNQKVESIIQSVATKQEIYNKKLEELNRLKPYLSVETYSRALQKAQDELKTTEKVTQNTTDQVSQLWVQSVRNIQTTLSNSLFTFFDNGLKGMFSNVKRTVLQIASEFVGLKIGKHLGLDKIMSGEASVGSLFSGGATLNSLFGFGKSATQLSAERGAFGLWGSSGATKASGLFGGLGSLGGTSIGAISGAAAALMASVGIGSSLAGNKKMFGMDGTTTSMIGTVFGGPVGAILGGAINALFGRSPYKFRQQSLQGTASIDGFEGNFTDVYRSKGGLFTSNKHKSVFKDLSQEQQDVFDQALDAFYGSAHNFAQKLGLNVDLVDGFTKEFQIKSEKGQQLTAEAIQDMLNGVGNDLAKNVLPIVDTFRKAGEDSFATLKRLSEEFVSLENAVMDLGATSSYAANLVSRLSIEQRTGIIEMAGGVERLSSLTGFFAENFLTNEERFNQANERLQTGLQALGIQTGLTNDQFKVMVQSLDTSNETRIKLLELAPALLTVNTALEQQKIVTDSLTDSSEDLSKAAEEAAKAYRDFLKNNVSNSFAGLQTAVDQERQKITENYNRQIESVRDRISQVTESIGKLKSFSESLKKTVNDISSVNREFAKAQIRTAISTGRIDQDKLQFAVAAVQDYSKGKFTSTFEMERERAKSAILLGELNTSVDKQVTDQQKELLALQNQEKTIQLGFDNQINRLDGILEAARLQVDILNGLNVNILSLSGAIGQFNFDATRAGLPGGIGGGVIRGNPNITDKQINDYLKTPGLTDMQIYNDAKKYGVSFEQFANATGKNINDLYAWAKKNNLPTFASGGFHSGGMRLVGESGPEVEFTGPSRIVSNKDISKVTGNDEVIHELRLLRAEISKGNNVMTNKINSGNKNIKAVMYGNATFKTSAQ